MVNNVMRPNLWMEPGKWFAMTSTRVYHKDGTISNYKSTKDMETHYQNGLQHGAEIRLWLRWQTDLGQSAPWKNGEKAWDFNWL